MKLRVGLTGGIASGKSTVRELLGGLGCHTIDADKLVAELYEPGRAGHAALVAAYGEEIQREDRTIDRAKLASIAFSDPAEAKKLNALIHPIVIAETEARLARIEEGIVVVEATLMIESGGRQRYDRIVVVDVDPAVQIERGVARGLAREEVLRRIANQIPREERLRYADHVIDNSGDRMHLERETRRVYELLRADLEAKT
ncbi:MAG TPA: dephospho-CoA kinase [Thermoanaerobaculia bacterium]|jgi:dephospho-CoA kinase|nr:dephospho-CoA kinase [Thermoanaerobaculia bacterium]